MHVASNKADRKVGLMQGLKNIVKDEGYAGLYKGIGPKIVQSVITAALLFAFKDALYGMTVAMRQKAVAAKALKLKIAAK